MAEPAPSPGARFEPMGWPLRLSVTLRILLVSRHDIGVLLVLAVSVLLILALFWKGIVAVAFDEPAIAARFAWAWVGERIAHVLPRRARPEGRRNAQVRRDTDFEESGAQLTERQRLQFPQAGDGPSTRADFFLYPLAAIWVGVVDRGPSATEPDEEATLAAETYAPYGTWPADGPEVAGEPVLTGLSADDLELLLEEMQP